MKNREPKFDMNGAAYMTSAIGDLPINSDGMRKAVDFIDKLIAENVRLTNERDDALNRAKEIADSAVKCEPMVMTSPIGDLMVDPIGLRKAIDEINRLNAIINAAN